LRCIKPTLDGVGRLLCLIGQRPFKFGKFGAGEG